MFKRRRLLVLGIGSFAGWFAALFASSLAALPFSYGATPNGALTVDAAIETAKENNPDLKKMQLSADSASWARLEAISEHLPHLEADGTHFFDARYSRLGIRFSGAAVDFPSAYPQTEFQLRASLTVFDGFASINRYRAASLGQDAAELEYSHAKFKMAQFIRVKYYQALAAFELAKVAQQNIETLEQHLRLAEASKRAGFSTNVDVLRIESQLEEARSERILANDNIVLARRALTQAMGLEGDERALDGALPVPESSKVPATLSLQVADREDLQAQTKRDQAQDRLDSADAGFWFPKISLFGLQQYYKYGEFDPAVIPNTAFQSAYSFGLKLSWNIFDGGASIARKAQANNAAKIEAENTRKLLIASPNDFEVWKRRYIYNAALYQARKRSVEKSAESVRLATISVRAGTKTHSETLDAELELFRARAGVIRAQLDAAEALANLELAVGHVL